MTEHAGTHTHVYMCAQSCSTLFISLDCSPPGSSVHGISQARILEWITISFSRGSSQPKDRTCVSCVSCFADRFFIRYFYFIFLAHHEACGILAPQQGIEPEFSALKVRSLSHETTKGVPPDWNFICSSYLISTGQHWSS